MRTLGRREWAELRFAHPGVDLTDPSDEFAVGLIAATHDIPADQARQVWEDGTESEALGTYQAALRMGVPSHEWARDLLHADARLAVEVRLCNRAGISHDAFLSWSDRAQDLAVASFLDEVSHCTRCGASAEAMKNPELARIEVEECWMCRLKEPLDKRLSESGEGGHKRLVVVPR
jgi:hypothetical protein